MTLFGDGDDIASSKSFFSIEEELEEDYEDTPLTWRGLPSSTFSDCTLVISNREDGAKTEATYHVHRAVLGASDRRCLYFMKASQKNQNNIDINLDYKAAQEAFPVMLDFVYFGKLDIETKNAEALRYLADVLQCRPLRMAVNKFIETDFAVETCIHYVRETSKFNDKPLLAVAIRESAKMFGKIDIEAFTKLDADLFYSIVSSQHFTCKDDDRLSKTILRYFDKNPQKLSSALLVKLTQAIPSIQLDEAKSFLQVMDKLDEDEDEANWIALTPLCIRCSEAVAPLLWTDDPVEAQDEFFDEGKWAGDGPSRVFITRLVACLKHAQDQCLLQQKAMEEVQDSAAKSANEANDLKAELLKTQIAHANHLDIATEPAETELRDEAPEPPSSPRYKDVCRDLAMSLSNKLQEKEQYIIELETELEKKEVELEKVGQMMVHLNARLKFYEILHNDNRDTSNQSPAPSSPRKVASRRQGSGASSAPTTPNRSSKVQAVATQPTRIPKSSRVSPARSDQHTHHQQAQQVRPPASPRFTFRHALNE